MRRIGMMLLCVILVGCADSAARTRERGVEVPASSLPTIGANWVHVPENPWWWGDAPPVQEQTNITVPADLLFAVGSAELTPSARTQLAAVLDAALTSSDTVITIEGHTDSDGKSFMNLELSRQRADAVAFWLIGEGVSRRRLVTRGFGESRPVVPNDTPEHKALNRRVEILLRED